MMLRKGQTFTLNGQRWKIAYINPSRAHCVNVTKHTVEIVDKRTGQTRRFTTTGYGAIDISPNRIAEIVNNRRRITADTALRLGLYFGNSPEFWMNLQTHYDLKIARRNLKPGDEKRIKARKAA